MTETENLGGFGATQSALLRLLLRNKTGLTVDQIATGLSVTRTAVNQHLTALERDGYVMRSDLAATAGRPSRIFALSDRGVDLFPKNYDMFSLKTLEALMSTLGVAEARKVLEKLGRDLASDLSLALKNKSLIYKSENIASVLKDLGYDAHVEEDAPKSKPVIKAYNCIYHNLAQAHPDVCALDIAFLKKASGAKVDHIACMAKGDNDCRFRFEG